MVTLTRFPGNPIVTPLATHLWEKEAAFNGCPIVAGGSCHLLYRAMGPAQQIQGRSVELSTIGHAVANDRVHFQHRSQLIKPEYPWETYGCEDPRVTLLDGKYYIFYTALADFPPSPSGIRVAVAITRDFKKIEERHKVTPFNAKAMTLFPDRINGKLAVILTANTDLPPSTIGIAYFDEEEDLWDHKKWDSWYKTLDDHAVPLLRNHHDHVEIGAPPLKTDKGWLLLYCYIQNYLSSYKTFGIEAALLDINDPRHILGHTRMPMLTPELTYELVGKIPNVIFPSGALIHNNNLGVYYGAADTSVALATCPLDELMRDLLKPDER